MNDSFGTGGFGHVISEHQSEARERISEYLEGRRSLADVEDWLWPFLADLEDADAESRNEAGVIGSIIAEYSYGDRSEESMRQELAVAIRPFDSDVRPSRGIVSFVRAIPLANSGEVARQDSLPGVVRWGARGASNNAVHDAEVLSERIPPRKEMGSALWCPSFTEARVRVQS